MNYKDNGRDTAPTIKEVVRTLKSWEKEHKPTDLGTKLNLFQYVQNIPEGSLTNGQGALVPLAKGVTRLPQIELLPHAHDQLLSRVSYNKNLFQRLPEKLNVLNINWLIQNEGDRSALLRLQDKSLARALMTTSYQPFDNLDLMTAIMPYIPKTSRVKLCYFTDDLFQIVVTFPRTKTTLKKGDVVERGIYIRNSETGLSSVTIAGYVHRLICTNGLIGTGGDGNGGFVRFRHTGDEDRLKTGIQSAIEHTYLESTKLIHQFKQSLKVAVNDPAERLEKIVSDNDLTPEMYKQMLDAFMEEPDKNLFGVVNAITATARELEGDQQYQLQRIATKELAGV